MKANSPVKILLVDDRAENLFALEVTLSNENYLCMRASSGKEALEILNREQDFAIILMDVQMPIMDGFETVEIIRQNEKIKLIPIIFLTASMDSSVQVFKGYLAGAVDYMIKPISPEILKAKVAVFVDLYKKTNELLVQVQQVKTLNSDIADHKEIKEKLEKSVKEISDYKYALDESSIVAITDQKGIIKYVNDNFCKISKFTRNELIGQDHRIINSGFHPKEFIRDLWTTIGNGKIWRGELNNKAKDGSMYWLDTTIVPFLNEQGKPYQYVAVRTDITERKRIEKEFMEAKVFAELATGIAEEAKRKAESATQIAEEAVKSKQQFLSNMSHEIRTPMNAIIGFTNVVLKTNLNAQQNEYLNAIKISGDALIVLINDILDLAKVDSGKMAFEQNPFDLCLSISTMLQLFEPKIKEKNLELLKEYDVSIPQFIVGDSMRLRQIILNLISNAVKFTAEGKITLRVRLLKEDAEKATIEFMLSDTGIGIPENRLENIFNNFEQAHPAISSSYGGTGLGLAIAKKFIELQGGTINVISKLGKGSTFIFVLNFGKINTQENPDNYCMAKGKELTTIQNNSDLVTVNNNIKVLIVEDVALN